MTHPRLTNNPIFRYSPSIIRTEAQVLKMNLAEDGFDSETLISQVSTLIVGCWLFCSGSLPLSCCDKKLHPGPKKLSVEAGTYEPRKVSISTKWAIFDEK